MMRDFVFTLGGPIFHWTLVHGVCIHKIILSCEPASISGYYFGFLFHGPVMMHVFAISVLFMFFQIDAYNFKLVYVWSSVSTHLRPAGSYKILTFILTTCDEVLN